MGATAVFICRHTFSLLIVSGCKITAILQPLFFVRIAKSLRLRYATSDERQVKSAQKGISTITPSDGHLGDSQFGY
jgi:hypothetical protein